MSSRFLTSLILAAGVSACASEPAPAPVQTGTKRVDAATVGSVTGRVSFDGQAPEPAVLRTSADRACDQGGAPLIDESLLVGGDGGLQNAFVYVKDGLGDYIFDAPTGPVVLDQKG